MCNVERFRHVNIQATDASQVFTRHLSDNEAMAFVRDCCDLLDRVDFVLPGSDRIYATAKNGTIVVDASLAPPDLVYRDPRRRDAFKRTARYARCQGPH